MVNSPPLLNVGTIKPNKKQPVVLSKQPIVLYLDVLRKVENCF